MHTQSSDESHRPLRAAEAVALVATTLAVGLTALLEPATAAVESNPVARVLLAELGWTGAGLVATAGLLVDGGSQLATAAPATATAVAGIGSLGCRRNWIAATDGGEPA
jgi:hypothetical protein